MADEKQPSVLGEARNAFGEFVLMLALLGIGGGIIAVLGIAIEDRDLQMVVGAVAGLALAIALLLLLKLLRKRTDNDPA